MNSQNCSGFRNISAFAIFVSSLEQDEVLSYLSVDSTAAKKFTKKLVVPTFDTKVTEYLCSGWVFFSSDKFPLFN